MNASASARPLILGLGNTLRSDDGLGRVVAERLIQAGNLDSKIMGVHQLTPELAQDMAAASLVVMIDASREGEAGKLHVRPLSPSHQLPGAAGTHHATPAELALFTATLYGRCPPVVVITMTGADFSVGEQLSPLIAQRIAQVEEMVRRVCKEPL